MSSFFVNLLNMSISSSFIVLVIVLFRFAFKKIPKYIFCILWGFVAIRLICPFSFESNLSLIPNNKEIENALLSSTSDNTFNKNIQNNVNVADNTLVTDYYIQTNENDNTTKIPENLNNNTNLSNENEITESTISTKSQAFNFLYIIELVYFLGVFIILLYSVVCYIRLQKQVRASIKIKENVFICDNIKTPFILGIFNPKIYLPSDMNKEEQNYVLLHEKSHLKRLDNFWKPFGFLLLSIHWFNPLIWLAYILFCNDIEFATDENVIVKLNEDGKKEYSQMLLLFSVENPKFVSACPVAFGEVSVKERIKKVLNYKSPSFLIILLSILVCIFVALFFLTTHKENIILTENTQNLNNEEIYNLSFGVVDDVTTASKDALNVNIFNLSGNTQNLLLYGFKDINKNDVLLYTYEQNKIIYFIKFKKLASKVLDVTNNSIKLEDKEYLFNNNDDYIIACLNFSNMYDTSSFYYTKNILDIDKENDKVDIQKYGDKYYIIVYKNRISDKEKNTPSTAVNIGDENFNKVWDIFKDGYFEEMNEEYNDMKKISIEEAIDIAIKRRIGTDYNSGDINARYLLYTNFYSNDMKKRPVVLITIDEKNTNTYSIKDNQEWEYMKTLVIIDSVTGEDLSLMHISYNSNLKENIVYSYKDIIINAENLNYDDLKNLQNEVNNGHYPWRLNAYETALEFMQNKYENVKTNDVITRYINPENAVITLNYNDTKYKLTLFKPVENGNSGIWVVKEFEVENNNVEISEKFKNVINRRRKLYFC